ncbi:MAG: hypothetical protein JNJ47_00920, partial [Alphaproteobacteria bacterium]|nr:hypothetical protein [Alphaproteobacteria bacterium]
MARIIKSTLKQYFLFSLILLNSLLITSKTIAMDEREHLLKDEPPHNLYVPKHPPAQQPVVDGDIPPAQPIPAQQPVVDGDIPPAQPIPAQQ